MKFLILLLLSIIFLGNVQCQTIGYVKTGGYIYPAAEANVTAALKHCPEGTPVWVNNTRKGDFFEVESGNVKGYMFYSALKDHQMINSFFANNTATYRPAEIVQVSNGSPSVTEVKLQRMAGNTFLIPCTLNGLKMNFIFDTGASKVMLSLTEARFMLKNGYLKISDITGKSQYKIADGSLQEGINVIIRELEFGGVKLHNITASISPQLEAPLLLGQSALSQLGKIAINYNDNTLTIIR